jgi:hypothetical protein
MYIYIYLCVYSPYGLSLCVAEQPGSLAHPGGLADSGLDLISGARRIHSLAAQSRPSLPAPSLVSLTTALRR